MKRHTRYQAVIVEDHRALMLKIEDGGQKFWLIPGGGIEEGETEEECVRREVREETHLRVEVDRLLLCERAPDDAYCEQRKTYLCRIVGGKARPGVEPEAGDAESPIKGLGWFDLRTPDSWDADGWHPSNAFPLLKQIRKELGYTLDSAPNP